MVDRAEIARQLKEKTAKRGELKRIAGLAKTDPQTVRRIRAGDPTVGEHYVDAVARAIGAPDAWTALVERVEKLEDWQRAVDARLAPVVEPEMIELRLVADLAAGPWQQADRQPDTVQVPRHLTDGDAQHWEVHRVRGTSMHLAGIDDGDLILCRNVRSSGNYRRGDVVCAQIQEADGIEGAIKRFDGEIDGRYVLAAESDSRTDHIDPVPTERCQIVGVVTARKEGARWVAVPRGSR